MKIERKRYVVMRNNRTEIWGGLAQHYSFRSIDDIGDFAIKTYRTEKQAHTCSSWDRDFEVVPIVETITDEDGYRKQSEWISVEERLPTKDEYLTHHNDGLDTLKRIAIAYMTDTVEYTIGCYDGYKWMNQLGNKKIENVVAWKPFELYEAPKMKGGKE